MIVSIHHICLPQLLIWGILLAFAAWKLELHVCCQRVPFCSQLSTQFIRFHLLWLKYNSSNHHCCHTRVTLASSKFRHHCLQSQTYDVDTLTVGSRLTLFLFLWGCVERTESKSRLSESDPGSSEVISIYMIIVIYLNFAYYICNSFHSRNLAFFLCFSPMGFGAPKRVHW